MRVAIVTETFLPKMDGIVRMLTEFLGHLRGHGHDALVIAPGAGPGEYAGVPGTPPARGALARLPRPDPRQPRPAPDRRPARLATGHRPSRRAGPPR